ncbi:LysM peptidoglycan-binding domain-containing protein [Ornithinimicrobium faecis]|uniref:LysM peptidoglycan-binding domain-containing protein n=1 Tax=Ornithinimicrobium faecis TaxID=2934158 RepID=UPI002117C2AA|nr:LysM domain-containing protein [Ornithinimicrobium sp. HY1745]
MERRNDRTGAPPDRSVPVDRVGLWAGMLGVALSAGCGLLGVVCARHATAVLGSTQEGLVPPALGLEVLAVGAAALIAAWLSLLFLLGAASALPGSRLALLRTVSVRLAPRLAPRIAAGLVGSVVVVSSAGVAQAHGPVVATTPASAPAAAPAAALEAAPEPGAAAEPAAAARPAPEPGWRPTTSPAHPSAGGAAIELVSRGTAEPDTVVVRGGDTLWDIAARHLGPEADAASIAETWPRWHEANRDTIGADPHLLLPGTVLVPPAELGTTSQVAS